MRRRLNDFAPPGQLKRSVLSFDMREARNLSYRILLGVAILSFAPVPTTAAQKLNTKKPSVYLTFKEFATSSNGGSPSQIARLILHNNSRWPIQLGEWMEPTLSGDAALIYTVELDNGCFGGRRHIDVVTTRKLMPGKSLSFTVPRSDLPKYSELFVGFNFSWELTNAGRLRDEVIHRAYFLSIALPGWPEQ
jgi:hypothetical protein